MKPILPHYRFRRKRNIIPVAIIDLIGKGLFRPLRWVKPPRDIGSVLMIRLDHIGDVVCSTPVFREWKSNYPKTKLSMKTLEEKLLKFSNDIRLQDDITIIEARYFG